MQSTPCKGQLSGLRRIQRTAKLLGTAYHALAQDARPGERMLVSHGRIELAEQC